MSVSNADIAKKIEDAIKSDPNWPIFLDSEFDKKTGNWIVWLEGEFQDHKVTIESVQRVTREDPLKEVWEAMDQLTMEDVLALMDEEEAASKNLSDDA